MLDENLDIIDAAVGNERKSSARWFDNQKAKGVLTTLSAAQRSAYNLYANSSVQRMPKKTWHE